MPNSGQQIVAIGRREFRHKKAIPQAEKAGTRHADTNRPNRAIYTDSFELLSLKRCFNFSLFRMFLLPSVCWDCDMDKKITLWCGWIVITVIDLSARNSYPAVYSCMAGGKETHELLPLALVHTQISRDVPQLQGRALKNDINAVNLCDVGLPLQCICFSRDFTTLHNH